MTDSSEKGTIVLEEIKAGEMEEETEDEDEDEEQQQEAKKIKKKVMIDWLCVNPVCKVVSKESLRTAPGFTTEFYGMKLDKKKKRKICSSCHKEALDVKTAMKERLLKQELCLLQDRPFPSCLLYTSPSPRD